VGGVRYDARRKTAAVTLPATRQATEIELVY
jgi:hypothetical protein